MAFLASSLIWADHFRPLSPNHTSYGEVSLGQGGQSDDDDSDDDSDDALQAQIDSLQAQIDALGGGSGGGFRVIDSLGQEVGLLLDEFSVARLINARWTSLPVSE